MKHAIAALALCACVKIPAFQGGGSAADAGIDSSGSDSGSGSGSGSGSDAAIDATPAPCDPATRVLTHLVVDGHEMVCGPRFEVRFAKTGAKLPDSFVIDGHEVLAAGGASCDPQRYIGLAVDPLGTVAPPAPDGTPDPVDDDLAITGSAITYAIESDFLIKLTVQWAAVARTLGACNEMMSGSSDFLFGLDGHITRHDHFAHAASDTDQTATACSSACRGGSAWTVTSMFAFADEPSQTISNFGLLPTAGGAQKPIDEAGNHFSTCVSSPTVTFGVGYSWDMGDTVASIVNQAPAWALVHKMTAELAMLGQFSTDARSIYLVPDAQGCAAIEATLEQHGDRRATVEVNLADFASHGTPLALGDGDGIYGGDAGAGVPVAPTAQSPMLVKPFNGRPLPAGSALWVHYAAVHTAFTVMSGADDVSASVRHVAPNGHPTDVVFYFPDLVPAGTDLTIAPTN